MGQYGQDRLSIAGILPIVYTAYKHLVSLKKFRAAEIIFSLLTLTVPLSEIGTLVAQLEHDRCFAPGL